jgi:adenylosuccinate synthase
MASRVILLSGPVASGKTTLAQKLVDRYGHHLFKTRELITSLTGSEVARGQLQQAGERLDRRTNGRWVASALEREVSRLDEDATVIVDAVRIKLQVEAIRDAFGQRVVHVHLTAPVETLAKRYSARSGAVQELKTYDSVRSNPTESHVEQLKDAADVVIDTQQNTPEDVFTRVASHLGLYGPGVERLVDVLIGGQYGSEGKGHVASYLAREYGLLLRVGGPNAGHSVYERPTPYKFHHLPSGTRSSDARIALGPGAVISLPVLLKEISECRVEADRLSIDPRAVVIEPKDVELEKKTLERSIGSTGQGVGAATARKILRGADGRPVRLAKDLKELKPYIRETRGILDLAFSRGQRVFLEGTQGTELSLHHGSYPHVTSRDTTVSGCLAEAGIAPSRVRRIIMVCRTYPIRVQNPAGSTSGPMSRELKWKEISQRSGIPLTELLAAEKTTTTGRRRRVAEFDWALLRKAASLNGPTDIALTFTDYLSILNRRARRLEQLEADTIRFIEEVERVGGAPVSLIVTRFHFRSIIDRRTW